AGAVDQQLNRRGGFQFVVGEAADVGERNVAQIDVDFARVVAWACASAGTDVAGDVGEGAVKYELAVVCSVGRTRYAETHCGH
nr:hypothetical protein [Tanacetum cinerariifolium]